MIKDTPGVSTILSSIGFTSLNLLQEETLQKSKENDNVMILSQTGSGKTFAFLLPLFLRLDVNVKNVQALIIVPSRELAIQIESVFPHRSIRSQARNRHLARNLIHLYFRKSLQNILHANTMDQYPYN